MITKRTLLCALAFAAHRSPPRTRPGRGRAEGPLVLAVHPSVPAKTVAELAAHAKPNTGKLNYVLLQRRCYD